MQVREPEPIDVIPTAERPRDHVLHRRRERIGIRATHVDRTMADVACGAMRGGYLPFDLRYLPTAPAHEYSPALT